MRDMSLLLREIREVGTGLRVHGNGFIQLDLPDSRRLNVWGHPSIPRQVVASQVHDHSFDFTSTVLKGVMVHVLWSIWHPNTMLGDQPLFEVYRPITRQGEDTFLDREPGLFKIAPGRTVVAQVGDSYDFKAGELHSTFVNEPTVTLIHRRPTDTKQPARVLLPQGVAPDNNFNRYDMPEARLWDIVRETLIG